MGTASRVLPAVPIATLADYVAVGGGRGLDLARKLGPAAVIDAVEASGLRGRGGAGFPKWRTVASDGSAEVPATVVAAPRVSRAPSRTVPSCAPTPSPSSKGRSSPPSPSALIARSSRSSTPLPPNGRGSIEIAEIRVAGWCGDVTVAVATGPSEYLFGEETGLLEVLDGRPPFPRIAPPFRHGVDEVGSEPDEPAGTRMAEPGAAGAPPTLANNVETIANIAPLLAEGAEWFRQVGTPESPGTIVCTVSGATRRHGVAEIALGTPLAEVIEAIGGGPVRGRRLVAAMSGVANPLVPAEAFTTPLTYEDMDRIGSGLGTGGFIVFDDRTDLAAVAAGVSRFLAVESCGQCTPCKQDGLALADLLGRVARSDANDDDLAGIADRVATVADEARCFLAHQHQQVLDSILRLFPDALRHHLQPGAAAVDPEPIVPIADLGGDDRFELALTQLDKQPDWSFDPVDSGKNPVDRLAEGGAPA